MKDQPLPFYSAVDLPEAFFIFYLVVLSGNDGKWDFCP